MVFGPYDGSFGMRRKYTMSAGAIRDLDRYSCRMRPQTLWVNTCSTKPDYLSDLCERIYRVCKASVDTVISVKK